MKIRFTILLLAVLAALTAGTDAREVPKTALESYQPWSEETVHTFENILVQDGGRVKPIYTIARFTLLQFSGKSSVKFETTDGEQHGVHYSAWLLDMLFRGDIAKDLPVFVVDDSEAVVQIGVSPKAKRDRYSYNELLPGRARLAELSSQYAEKQRNYEQSEKDPQYELDRIEGMILSLGRNVVSFENLIRQFGFARQGELLVNEDLMPEELMTLAKKIDLIEMMDKLPELTLEELFRLIQMPDSGSEDERMFADALRVYFLHANTSQGLILFPPRDKETEEWLSAGDVMILGLESKEARPWAQEQLRSISELVKAETTGEDAFHAALAEFSKNQEQIAADRGEGKYSEMEITLYRGKWFTYALMCFTIGFVFVAFSWLAPGSLYGKIMVAIACLFALIGFYLDCHGITLRSIIRQRPPITNLYDTILFITATAVLLGLILELLTRIGVGALLATFSGMLGMFLSMKYEAKEATDTITQLVAVLDTNFWLATHVTIINIGYAAGMKAALLGMLYLGLRFVFVLLGKESKTLFRSLSRMNYGIICFCLFFSLVGTVLGGIWANYSWGRFWGWDPKENGALMICLWTLVILHGRMAGWIRELGVNMNSVILGIIVTFSWWGVNNLGVGLHSYGFTEGVWGMLYLSWAVMGIFLLMGVVTWIVERGRRSTPPRPAPGHDPAMA